MNLNQAVLKQYDTHWSLTNTFYVRITPSAEMQEKGIDFKAEDDLFIVQASLPSLTNNAIESWTFRRFRLGNGADQAYRFSITFKDHNFLQLWKMFQKQYRYTRSSYPQKCWFSIDFMKESDDPSIKQAEKIISFKNCLIESLGNIDFSNDKTPEIVSFTVNFKSSLLVL